ncbi:TetR family transcriptional regulator [Kibdelosporangium aridum]|uniref:TetR family transcriptional regulator n=1 Tax=Kibdelosporangium aridum TaxID=2030 RepID=A0A428Z3W8_KIBAR|nr:TetR family transcriptional regulator [Kibdelosporangium aridum]
MSAAAETFIAQGFQRTQMQDVADALGVAKGTVYGYVENKAALLAAAVRYADGIEELPGLAELPVPAPAEGELAALVADRLGHEVAELRLVKAMAGRRREPIADELTAIIADLYQRLARHRVSIKLIDRCAPELPDLGEVWFGAGRSGQVAALTDYLARRAATGAVRLPGPAPVVARTILETCVLWAVHLHWDPAGDRELLPSDTVASTLAGLLTHGLISRKGETP